MNKVQAENRAIVLNKMVKHPSLSYKAILMDDNGRWAVGQYFNESFCGVS